MAVLKAVGSARLKRLRGAVLAVFCLGTRPPKLTTDACRGGVLLYAVFAIAGGLLAVLPGVVEAASPANDSLAAATTVAGIPHASSVITSEATLQAGEPSPHCELGQTNIGNTVWYRYTAGSSVTMIADTVGSDFDTVLTVFSGPSTSPTFASLDRITCNDDGGGSLTSKLTFAVSAGTTYYLQAGGFDGGSGTLHFNLGQMVANDDLGDATEVVALPYSDSVITSTATIEIGEPNATCEFGQTNIGRTVWYRYTPQSSASLVADTIGSGFDTVIAVYSGPATRPDFADLFPVGCDDDSGGSYTSSHRFSATQGVTYYFQVGGFAGNSGSLNFRLSLPDVDADGIPDELDNCPKWPNPSQTQPTWPIPLGDSDCDGFSDGVGQSLLAAESYIGTDPARQCAVDNAANNEPNLDDAWPMDFNDNRLANGQDFLTFIYSFAQPISGPAITVPAMGTFEPERWDFTGNGIINGQDFLKYINFFAETCSLSGG